MRIVFMGASELGWECCQTLFKIGQDVVGIFSIPPEFRISWSVTPVKNVRYKSFEDLAQQHSLPLVYVTRKTSDPEYQDVLRQLKPDVLVVIGWYYMVPSVMRQLAPLGAVGIHASLLPKYRGGAPLVWAMINGEEYTGVTLFHFSDGVDDGDIIGQERFEIANDDDIAQVVGKATNASVNQIRKFIPLLADGQAPKMPQDHGQATSVPQRKPEDGLIDWCNMSASQVYNWVRAQTVPYPGAFTFLGDEKLIIWRAGVTTYSKPAAKPGEILVNSSELGPDSLGVWCADGQLLKVRQVGLPDSTSMSGAEFVRSRYLAGGVVLG